MDDNRIWDFEQELWTGPADATTARYQTTW
jgi:hypothetical protein